VTCIAQLHAVADEQQPDENREWIAVVSERASRRRPLVSSQRRNRGRTDALYDAIDRVRRTAQRVGDALRRCGV